MDNIKYKLAQDLIGDSTHALYKKQKEISDNIGNKLMEVLNGRLKEKNLNIDDVVAKRLPGDEHTHYFIGDERILSVSEIKLKIVQEPEDIKENTFKIHADQFYY